MITVSEPMNGPPSPNRGITRFSKPKNTSLSENQPVERGVVVAEQLEARILYSGAPAAPQSHDSSPLTAPLATDQCFARQFHTVGEFADFATHKYSDLEIEGNESQNSDLTKFVTLTSLDNLTDEEIAGLTYEASQQHPGNTIANTQISDVSVSIVHLDADISRLPGSYEIEINLNTNNGGCFFDNTAFGTESRGFQRSLTVFRPEEPKAYGIDHLNTFFHKPIRVLGLEDIYNSMIENGLIRNL